MIRHLHPTDSPALLQFKQRSGPDEARSLSQALKGGQKGFPLVKYTTIALSPRAWQSCWVKTRRASVQAVLRAGPRSGPMAWDVTELYLARNNREVATEVLEQIAFPAGTSGARRVFLRLPSDSELFNSARAAGYLPIYGETLFSAKSGNEVVSRLGESPDGLALRQLDSEDAHVLFRLFCATVPINVRSKTGQTLEEWGSSIESPSRKRQEWGFQDPGTGRLQARVDSCQVAGGHYFSVTAAPDANCDLVSLVLAGARQAGDRRVFTLVPDYDEKLGETLTEIGFTRSETYDVMVKTLAVRVAKPVPGMAAIER